MLQYVGAVWLHPVTGQLSSLLIIFRNGAEHHHWYCEPDMETQLSANGSTPVHLPQSCQLGGTFMFPLGGRGLVLISNITPYSQLGGSAVPSHTHV